MPFGVRNGLDHESVISCDHITTVRVDAVGAMIGLLLDDQEAELTRAIGDAFDLLVRCGRWSLRSLREEPNRAPQVRTRRTDEPIHARNARLASPIAWCVRPS